MFSDWICSVPSVVKPGSDKCRVQVSERRWCAPVHFLVTAMAHSLWICWFPAATAAFVCMLIFNYHLVIPVGTILNLAWMHFALIVERKPSPVHYLSQLRHSRQLRLSNGLRSASYTCQFDAINVALEKKTDTIVLNRIVRVGWCIQPINCIVQKEWFIHSKAAQSCLYNCFISV